MDLAAAPGGKTLHMAALMQNKGRIAAVESVRSRFFRLRRNLEQFGVKIADTYLKDGAQVWRVRPEHFDRVLLDAPCSGEGRFTTTDPKSFAYWSEKKIPGVAATTARSTMALPASSWVTPTRRVARSVSTGLICSRSCPARRSNGTSMTLLPRYNTVSRDQGSGSPSSRTARLSKKHKGMVPLHRVGNIGHGSNRTNIIADFQNIPRRDTEPLCISGVNFQVLPPDPHRLDGDKDGIGCEG